MTKAEKLQKEIERLKGKQDGLLSSYNIVMSEQRAKHKALGIRIYNLGLEVDLAKD